MTLLDERYPDLPQGPILGFQVIADSGETSPVLYDLNAAHALRLEMIGTNHTAEFIHVVALRHLPTPDELAAAGEI